MTPGVIHNTLLWGLLMSAGCASLDSDRERAAIVGVLNAQAEAWNRGDLESFLTGYWRSEETVFAGGDQVHRGWEAMAARYRTAYPTREKMGRLAFSKLTFEQLEADRAVVTGSWELTLEGSAAKPHGVFTLLWRRFPEGWKIVHDHTSSAKE